MKKRILSFALCLAILIFAFPPFGMTASAAGEIPLGTYVNEDYGSSVTFRADQTFSFVVNFGEGFATVTGTYSVWEEDDGGVTAMLKVTSKHTGILVDSTYSFNGAPMEDGILYLTDNGAGIIPADTAFKFKTVGESSVSPAEQIAAGRAAVAAAVMSNHEAYAASHGAAVASGHTYTGYRGAALANWAVREVGIADALNLMPPEVSDYFQEPIARVDFAALVHSALLHLTGMTESQLKAAVIPGHFPDCSDEKVNICAGLGIITGDNTGKFLPDKSITRQEAAAMLSRLAEVIGAKATGAAGSFADISGWSESYIKNISAFKDGYTGNAVMGGTGANRFSPLEGYSRQQAVVTIVRLTGVSAGGTAADISKEGSYEAVSAAVEAKADALWADGSLSDGDVQEILDFAADMEEKGLVRDLVVDGTSVFYTTADGTPSGIVIDYRMESKDGQPAFGSGGAYPDSGMAELPGGVVAAANDKLYLKNNKVLFITSFAKNDATYFQPLQDGIQMLKSKGYDVTVQNSASLSQYADIGSGDYSMIFICSHGSVVNGQFYFWTEVDKDTAIADELYLLEGQVRIVDHIPGWDFGVYHFYREYYIAPEFFANHLKNDPLDGAYVQFISCMSMNNQNMSNVFLANGAKAVSGYNGPVLVSYATDVFEMTAELLTPAKDQTDGDEGTVGELESGVIDELGLHIFDNKLDGRKMISRFDAVGAENMILAVNNEVKYGTGLTVSGSYMVSKGSLGLLNFQIAATVTNNTGETLDNVDLCWEDYQGQPTSKRYPNASIKSAIGKNEVLSIKPGESYTFEITIERLYDKDYFAIIIPSYNVGGYKVEIPVEEYRVFPLTKIG